MATNGSFAIKPLAAEVAAEKLAGSLFSPGAQQKTANFFRLENGHTPDQATLDSLCLRLTSLVPCFDCSLGVNIYAEDRLATTFVESLIEQASGQSKLRPRSFPREIPNSQF